MAKVTFQARIRRWLYHWCFLNRAYQAPVPGPKYGINLVISSANSAVLVASSWSWGFGL